MTDRLLTSFAYGRRVGLRVSRLDERRLRDVLPFWWADDDVAPEATWDVAGGDLERTVRTMELWVAEHALDRVFVHAGAVVVAGRALLLPGRSMAGKTTLTAALLRAGAQYLSDEYAVLDDTGRVHPYPRPLTVRHTYGRSRVAPEELGATRATSPAQIGVVAAIRYVGGTEWQPEPLTPAETVLRLLDNTVSARSGSAAALAAVSTAVSGAVCVAGERDDPATVVAWLFATLAGARGTG